MPEVQTEYLGSLELSPLVLDVFVSEPYRNEDFPKRLTKLAEAVWPQFMRIGAEESVFEILGLRTDQAWEIELNFVTNPEIHDLNRDYRDKDQATDVLTFTLLADAEGKAAWTQLPVVQLGSIFISIDWAKEAVSENETVERYVMERFVHGLLHLMGLHHDTMSAYHKVVAIQKRVLDAVF